MEKQVFVQLRGVEKAIQLLGDSVEYSGEKGSKNYTFKVVKRAELVGEFDGNAIVGWWFII